MVDHVASFHTALRNPTSVYDTPERVLADPRLDTEGRRAILESWEEKTQAGHCFPASTPKAKRRIFRKRIHRALDKLKRVEETRIWDSRSDKSGL